MIRNLILIAVSFLFLLNLPVLGQRPDNSIPLTRGEAPANEAPSRESLKLKKIIRGDIRPKSIAYSGNGRFFAQNMMYRHSITVYDRNFNQIAALKDQVDLSQFKVGEHTGVVKGAPVEATFTPDGNYAWVSNYAMSGPGFNNPGNDNCLPNQTYDNSFLYKINTRTLEIENVVEVGCVPKFVSISPDNRLLLVSNWCSADLSIVDLRSETEIKRIPLGKYPRGIVIDSKSRYAYVSIMGEDKIAIIKLTDGSVSWLDNIGDTPRHLCLGPADRYLYVSLDREGKVKKYDLIRSRIAGETETGEGPRSMTLSPNGEILYVANYQGNTLSRVRTEDMAITQHISTHQQPIGTTFDPETQSLWVACYTGSIMVFQDEDMIPLRDLSVSHIPMQVPPSQEENNTYSYVPGMDTRSEDPNYYLYSDREQKARAVAPANPSEGYTYYVIVGSFTTQQAAAQSVKALRAKGFTPEILPIEKGGYRVSSKSYPRQDLAQQAVGTLKVRYNMDSWIWRTKD